MTVEKCGGWRPKSAAWTRPSIPACGRWVQKSCELRNNWPTGVRPRPPAGARCVRCHAQRLGELRSCNPAADPESIGRRTKNRRSGRKADYCEGKRRGGDTFLGSEVSLKVVPGTRSKPQGTPCWFGRSVRGVDVASGESACWRMTGSAGAHSRDPGAANPSRGSGPSGFRRFADAPLVTEFRGANEMLWFYLTTSTQTADRPLRAWTT
jgi:hypothetical protein